MKPVESKAVKVVQLATISSYKIQWQHLLYLARSRLGTSARVLFIHQFSLFLFTFMYLAAVLSVRPGQNTCIMYEITVLNLPSYEF